MILGFVVASLFLCSKKASVSERDEQDEERDEEQDEETKRIEGGAGVELRKAAKTLLKVLSTSARVCIVVYCFALDTAAAPNVLNEVVDEALDAGEGVWANAWQLKDASDELR